MLALWRGSGVEGQDMSLGTILLIVVVLIPIGTVGKFMLL
jgi:hypothetical protein